MKKTALLLVLAGVLTACNPLILTVPKTETIEFTVEAGDYVTRNLGDSNEDFIRIRNEEIIADREIEVYYHPTTIDYWGLVIDVDIFIYDEGGEMLIRDPRDIFNNLIYIGSDIRVIITWYVEEEHQFEEEA